jgi:hypothetical protein
MGGPPLYHPAGKPKPECEILHDYYTTKIPKWTQKLLKMDFLNNWPLTIIFAWLIMEAGGNYGNY